MRLLILGGTRFVGRAVAQAGVARGWQVTVLHRGVTGPPPAGTESVHGDRLRDGLAGLGSRQWDVVLDTWDGPPQVVAAATQVLGEACARYVYVSSRSVYRDLSTPGLTEDSPLVDITAPPVTYGAVKAGAEEHVRSRFGPRALIARPGLVLGPHEQPERLVWWLRRIARGGDVPAPGPPDLTLQYIDVRDLAGWLLEAAAAGLGGVFNVVGPPGHTTTAALLDACVAATGSGARLRWTPPEQVLAAGVQPWSELPIWVPVGSPARGLHETSADRAYAAGLHCRPAGQTVADTWAWLRETGATAGAGGLDPAREAALLSAAP